MTEDIAALVAALREEASDPQYGWIEYDVGDKAHIVVPPASVLTLISAYEEAVRERDEARAVIDSDHLTIVRASNALGDWMLIPPDGVDLTLEDGIERLKGALEEAVRERDFSRAELALIRTQYVEACAILRSERDAAIRERDEAKARVAELEKVLDWIGYAPPGRTGPTLSEAIKGARAVLNRGDEHDPR